MIYSTPCGNQQGSTLNQQVNHSRTFPQFKRPNEYHYWYFGKVEGTAVSFHTVKLTTAVDIAILGHSFTGPVRSSCREGALGTHTTCDWINSRMNAEVSLQDIETPF
jgi:hypothetical protein